MFLQEKWRQETLLLIKRMLQIKTTNPPGGEGKLS